MKKIDSILEERGSNYGDFSAMAGYVQDLKADIVEPLRRHKEACPIVLEALDMICTKIGRIVTGDPHHEDSWRDIEGYAKLVADRLADAPVLADSYPGHDGIIKHVHPASSSQTTQPMVHSVIQDSCETVLSTQNETVSAGVVAPHEEEPRVDHGPASYTMTVDDPVVNRHSW